jgi:Protein of unknown function (DUF4435)
MTDERVYAPTEYRKMVRMSLPKYILVEGEDDKRCLMYLVEEVFGEIEGLEIHGAYQILYGAEAKDQEKIGNREKVEEMAQIIGTWEDEDAGRFVGFVDREFRDFDFQSGIKDLLGKHNVIDRLVWSRGHSIENYFFDFAVLFRPLRHHSVTSYYKDALDLFKQNMEQILKEACAVGLAAWKCHLLEPVRGSVADWEIVEMGDTGIALNIVEWMHILTTKQKIRYEDALSLKEAFLEWSVKVSAIDFDTVRWLCDGHTGLTFLWAAFARCVFEVSKESGRGDPRQVAKRVLKSEKTVRFNACASEWAFQVSKNSCEHPVDIFTILGISNNNVVS